MCYSIDSLTILSYQCRLLIDKGFFIIRSEHLISTHLSLKAIPKSLEVHKILKEQQIYIQLLRDQKWL